MPLLTSITWEREGLRRPLVRNSRQPVIEKREERRVQRIAEGFRLIDTKAGDDVALLHRLLETREPISNVLGVVNEKAVFCFNEGSRPLHYAKDLDVIVCMEREGNVLKLFDIVGPKIPSLNAILERTPQRVEEVEIRFSPDRLSVDATAMPYVLDHDGPSNFMVRGPFAAEGEAFTLPRSART